MTSNTRITWSFDLFGPIFLLLCILLAVGTIPFTPVAVGLLLIASKLEFTLSWSR